MFNRPTMWEGVYDGEVLYLWLTPPRPQGYYVDLDDWLFWNAS